MEESTGTSGRKTERLTYSRLAARRMCPRKDYYANELRVRRDVSAAPFRIGTAFALGKELQRQGMSADDAVNQATEPYDVCPPDVDPYEYEIEAMTVRVLLAAYFWRYENDDIEFIAVEQEFDVPLINPETGAASRTFTMAGKSDAIVRLPDGRMAVYEDKTTGSDIAPGGSYWTRLRFDGQISQYVLGGRALGHPIDCVLYDVTRKPSIKPNPVPILDDDDLKIVTVDETGDRAINKNGKPRQVAGDGFTLKTRPMTPDEWGTILCDDIATRPEWYFHREEIQRLESDLIEFQAEVWQQAHQLRECRRGNWWFRNVAWNTCQWCEYEGPCLSGGGIDPANIPPGFVVKPANSELSQPET